MIKMMKVDYLGFLERYESSGLTQSKFGKQEGMSSSMVSYYVRRGRELRDAEGSSGFSEVSLSGSARRVVRISYPSGVLIEIPL